MQIKIEGDGTVEGRDKRIIVTNAETGELIENVMKVELIIDPNAGVTHPIAIITVFNPALALTVYAKVKESGE